MYITKSKIFNIKEYNINNVPRFALKFLLKHYPKQEINKIKSSYDISFKFSIFEQNNQIILLISYLSKDKYNNYKLAFHKAITSKYYYNEYNYFYFKLNLMKTIYNYSPRIYNFFSPLIERIL